MTHWPRHCSLTRTSNQPAGAPGRRPLIRGEDTGPVASVGTRWKEAGSAAGGRWLDEVQQDQRLPGAAGAQVPAPWVLVSPA